MLKRCYTTLFPFSPSYLTTLSAGCDLYGPFWVSTTLILALFLSSSLAASISKYLSAPNTQYDYNFGLLGLAATIVYTYSFGVPLALWLALRYLGVGEWGIVDALGVWGYAQFVWIPVSVSCIACIHGTHTDKHTIGAVCHTRVHYALGPRRRRFWYFWILSCGECVPHSFERKSFSRSCVLCWLTLVALKADAKATRLLIIVVAALHAALALTFKVLFFSYYVVHDLSGGSDPLR